jgi:hypothetical protein
MDKRLRIESRRQAAIICADKAILAEAFDYSSFFSFF